ncbi:MAG: hypothetical protein KDB07_08510, partial [Planctomycetes bacterium]|nr:hypothetical protein [Planctomycetota bacterium]
ALTAIGLASASNAASDEAIQRYLNNSGSSSSGVSKAKGARFGLNLGAFASLVDYEFLNTDSLGSTLAWDGPDVQGDEWNLGGEASVFFRAWDHEFGLTYQGLVMTSFSDRSTQDVDFGSATIPASSDLDARAALHHFVLEDRKMRWTLDEAGKVKLGYSYGLAYDVVRMGLNSDGFPIEKDSQRMKELLPYPILGLHLDWNPMESWGVRFSARFGYLPEITTFQKRNGEDLNQETMYLEVGAVDEWRVNKWFVVWGAAKYQIFDHKLVGDGPQPSATQQRVEQSFEMNLLTLSLGVGFRF